MTKTLEQVAEELDKQFRHHHIVYNDHGGCRPCECKQCSFLSEVIKAMCSHPSIVEAFRDRERLDYILDKNNYRFIVYQNANDWNRNPVFSREVIDSAIAQQEKESEI
jgi:hypothetical protein